MPTIVNMSVTPGNLPPGGGDVVVDAIVTGADSVTLDGVPVTLPATVNVTAEHTFTLVASGSASATAAVGIMVPAPRYRSDQPYLLQHVRSRIEPDRVHQPGSADLVLDGTGTAGADRVQACGGPVSTGVADHIDYSVGWAFDSKGKGGDWIDRNLVRNPATPVHWLSVPLNAVPSGAHEYAVDATAALQLIQQQGRWNAWSFTRSGGGGSVREMGGAASAVPPRFDVVYADGLSASLPCRVTAMMSGASAYPFTIVNQTGLPQFDLPVVSEFEKPTRPVASASLVFTIVKHTSLPATFQGNILDPRLNTDPVTYGVAQQAGPFDAGLWSVPSIINAHQYLDNAPESDFIDFTKPQNTDDEKNFSPDMIWPEHTGNPSPGPYVADTSKYPYSSSPSGGKHKWIGMTSANAFQFAKVPSTYAHEDFEALAPGIGAIRVYIPPLPGIADGTMETSASWQTVLARIFLPADLWGQKTIFTRYYWRLGCPTRFQGADPLGPPDVPYRMPIAEKYQVHNSSGHWIFTDCAGKTGINPEQVTGYGGFSGTAGGGGGTQFRDSFSDMYSADDGPDVGGLSLGKHLYDYGARNPPGFQYNGAGGNQTQWGQRGGLGAIMYSGVWYCIEKETTLNDVRDASGNIIGPLPENNMLGGFLPNGVLRTWIDGRLVQELTGMVFRTAPYTYAGSKYGSMSFVDPGYNKALRRQCKDLGHIAVMLNKYHGGVTQNSVHRTEFYAQLAYGTQRIGPMKFA